MIKRYEHKGQLIAIIIPANYHAEGITFFTPDDFSQQLAYMNRPEGYSIEPHVHRRVERAIHYTLETLFVRKGKVKVDLYTNDKVFLESTIVESGDILLLASGGHGFTMIEPTEMIEVKQGPYVNEMDKERFKGIKINE